MEQPNLCVFSMAGHSGMGRFTSEIAAAAQRLFPATVVLVAPPMEHEPIVSKRILFHGPLQNHSRRKRLLRLVFMNLSASFCVLRSTRRGDIFLMIDVFPTIPLSFLPLIAARARGAKCVLNIHDFYPHTLRYPNRTQSIERFLYRYFYRRFDFILAMNRKQILRLQYEAAVSKDRIGLIQHGSFPVKNVVRPTEGEPLRILIFGSLRKNKRILESIYAVKELRGSGVEISLRIAGAPRREEKNYWEICKTALKAINNAWPETIEVFDRYIEDDEFSSILSGVDAVLCPYEDFDSQSGVSIIAVSNGIPLVASRAASVKELKPIVEVTEPISARSISVALSQLSLIHRTDRLAYGKSMRNQFESQRHWDEAIHKVARRFFPAFELSGGVDG